MANEKVVEMTVVENTEENEESNTLGFKFPTEIDLPCGIKMIRPYIPYEQSRAIIGLLTTIDSPIEREFALNCILLEACCGITDECDYDVLYANGVFDDIRHVLEAYIDIIEESVEDNRSMDNAIKGFLEDMSKLADEAIGKIPSKKKMDKLIDKIMSKLDSTDSININDIAKSLKGFGSNEQADK
jgi:hypothetical protein